MEGGPFLTQGVGLIKGHTASVNCRYFAIGLFVQTINPGEGVRDSLDTGAYVAVSLIGLTRPDRDPESSCHLGSCFYLWDPRGTQEPLEEGFT